MGNPIIVQNLQIVVEAKMLLQIYTMVMLTIKITKIIRMMIRHSRKALLLKMVFQQMAVLHMGLKFQEREGRKMTIGAETSTVNIAINNIYHIQHFILISNKSIVKDQMVKLYLCQQVGEVEEDQRKIQIKDMIQNQKNSFVILKEKVVQ